MAEWQWTEDQSPGVHSAVYSSQRFILTAGEHLIGYVQSDSDYAVWIDDVLWDPYGWPHFDLFPRLTRLVGRVRRLLTH